MLAPDVICVLLVLSVLSVKIFDELFVTVSQLVYAETVSRTLCGWNWFRVSSSLGCVECTRAV